MATITQKFKIYGLKFFIIYSFIEIGRLIARKTQKTFSQNKEDLIIEKLLGYKAKSYVDIGSNHPIKFNNTYRFYLFGAQGINIEPNISLIHSYERLRTRDKNIHLGLAEKECTKNFYQLDPDVDSTFSKKQATTKLKSGCRLISKYKVKISTLKQILSKYFKNKNIDLLSIDTEGYDYQILQSNDWKKYHPKIICVEDNSLKIQKYLISNSYALKSITNNNSIYVDER